MFWRIGDSLDRLQEMTVALNRTELGGYLSASDNYLSVTRSRMFVADSSKIAITCSRANQIPFLYPCSKQKEWHEMPAAERDAMIEESFMVGKEISEDFRNHMTHAIGFSDKEYLISFETDEPRDFLALAAELRETAGSKFTREGLPVYTCRQRTLLECLDALG